ncbi:alpha/beta hydrolase [Reticulibacter mediterranei]|uniref:Alpha/beta hydrolase n=1 Tax=Reticulibacter mediterranei TaxID=2778369 RepID=A0A8J3J2M5_9CHLR|nr:alpha/beta fold hydrolase [Reticulibacter mediterranei]GHP01176.1 alpha/beta hydrolase [Reticulibacter mediterranei]
MSILHVPGAQLFYEVSGSGPLLLLIPGAAGTGAVFHKLAFSLISRYQVVIYDRRGFSHSPLDGPQDDAHRLQTDADDVRRLLEHLTDQPAIVFGNSSGAIVALTALIQSPRHMHKVVAHEPPLVALMPDAAYWWGVFERIYDSSRKNGIPKAMHQFTSRIMGKEERQIIERLMKEQANEFALANAAYWMEYELRQYPRAQLDLDALATYANQLVLVSGSNSRQQMTAQPNQLLAERFGFDLSEVPGGHLGFLSHLAPFANALMSLLRREPL